MASRAGQDPANEGAPGWDDWPAPAPPRDDYYTEEPILPSSDPWAESWSVEEADAMLGAPPSAPEPERPEPPAPDWQAGLEPEPEVFEAPASLEPPAQPEPEPEAEPRIEPWSPDLDPWRFEPDTVEEPTATAPAAEPEVSPATAEPEIEAEAEVEPPPPEPEADTFEPEPDFGAAPEPGGIAEPVVRWPTPREELPDWLAEPLPAPGTEARPEPFIPLPGQRAAAAEPAADAIEPEPDAEAADALPELEHEPEAPSVPFWKSILPWHSSEPDAAGTPDVAEPEPIAEPEPEPQIDEPSDVEPAAFVPITGGLTYEPAAPDAEIEAEAEADADAGLDEGIDLDPWTAPTEPPAEDPWIEAGAGEPEIEPEALPDIEPDLEHDLEPVAAVQPDGAEPEADRGWTEPDWSDGGESTRVLPTDWTAPQPERTPDVAELQAGPIRTRLASADADADADEDAEPDATVAEQAVPWLIGVILLLAGMVIVLLALIFAGDGSLGGGADASPELSPTLAAIGGTLSPSPSPSATPTASPSADASATPAPTPSTEPLPEYGALEMVYQGRAAALAPIYLLHHDFTLDEDPEVLAQDGDLDVRRFAWAPAGRVGAGLLADVLVSIEPGEAKRRLGDGLSAVTFGEDGSTVYAVRITEDGTDEVATIVEVDFASEDASDLASVTYERPDVGSEAQLEEAAFADDGGAVRLYWTADDVLHLWVIGGGAWRIDPADGTTHPIDGGALPILWSPDGKSRIDVSEDDGTSTLTLRNANGRAMASTEVEGLVSHVRWSPGSDRVVFTLGRAASNGGILQDLFLWDLGDGEAPMQLTSTGAAFGAEWRGTQPLWREE